MEVTLATESEVTAYIQECDKLDELRRIAKLVRTRLRELNANVPQVLLLGEHTEDLVWQERDFSQLFKTELSKGEFRLVTALSLNRVDNLDHTLIFKMQSGGRVDPELTDAETVDLLQKGAKHVIPVVLAGNDNGVALGLTSIDHSGLNLRLDNGKVQQDKEDKISPMCWTLGYRAFKTGFVNKKVVLRALEKISGQ